MLTTRSFVVLALGGSLVVPAVLQEASATTINLDTGKSVSLAPGESGSVTFSVTNVDAGDVTDFLGWRMGIQIIPSGGNTGSLTSGLLTAAVSDQMPVGSVSITQPSSQTLANGDTINGSTTFSFMGIDSTTELGTLISGNTYNLGSLSLEASADASGVWDIYAVQQNSPFLKTYYFNGSSAETQFGNLAFGEGSVGLAVGTVTVTPVPEPSTAWLFAVAVATGVFVRRRQMQRKGSGQSGWSGNAETGVDFALGA